MSDTWCPYPWMNLNSNTDGRVKLCCSIVEEEHVSAGGTALNFAHDSIETIWHSSYMHQVRSDMLAGRKPAACRVCWRLENENVTSSRQAAVRAYGAWLPPDSRGAEADLPTSLELRLGNSCNLGCMTCWSLSSSAIQAERQRALKTALPEWLRGAWSSEVEQAMHIDQKWYRQPSFLESFEKMAPKLRRLYLTGGEPTLIRENAEFLQRLLRHDNRSCHVSFTTNATVWNEDFYGLLQEFRGSEVQVSIDGFGAWNEYVRYPSKWSAVERNLRRIFALPPKVAVKIFTVVSLLNVAGLDPLWSWLNREFAWRPHIHAPILLQEPKFLSTHLLQADYRNEQARRLESLLGRAPDGPARWWRNGVQSVQRHLQFGLEESERTVRVKEAKDYISAHERLRGNRHPERDDLFASGLA